jgi:hypothetical protein
MPGPTVDMGNMGIWQKVVSKQVSSKQILHSNPYQLMVSTLFVACVSPCRYWSTLTMQEELSCSSWREVKDCCVPDSSTDQNFPLMPASIRVYAPEL